MTPKAKRFVDEYMVDLNATQAAIRAGYSAKTAYSAGQRLLKHVEVEKALSAKSEKRAEKTEINAEYVLTQAVKLHERCMDKDKFIPAAAAKALELVGKHVDVQAFLERRQIEHIDPYSELEDARQSRKATESRAVH